MDRQYGCSSKQKTIGQASGVSENYFRLAHELVTAPIPFASPCPFCYTLDFLTVRGQAEQALLTLTVARGSVTHPSPGLLWNLVCVCAVF